MHQTLFVIPHWVFEGPLLVTWLVLGAVILAWLFSRHGNASETWSFLPVYGIVALAIHFALPRVEIMGIDPANPIGPPIVMGIAIRGYGLMLLLGIVSGVGVTLMRAGKVNISADDILGLGFWMMVCGIAGARLFYVIQKSDDFLTGDSFVNVVSSMLNMTKGGLVVYGSLFGGAIAAFVYLRMNKLSFLKTADLIAPGMVLGLAIGRLGCLMNGCCFGGVCEAPLPSFTFPAGSAPYVQQLAQGELLGAKTTPNLDPVSPYLLDVEEVKPGSIADNLGIQKGDELTVKYGDPDLIRFRKDNPDSDFGEKSLAVFLDSKQKGEIPLAVDDLPDRSLDTHPTQVYSSINAALLCLLLWWYWTVKKSDGEVFAAMLIFYSIGRFLMELIRQDELGQFGTSLTISQWVSIATIVVGFALFAFARSRHQPEPSLQSG